MSRIGKALIEIPTGVSVNVSAENVVNVKGPKGELNEKIDSSFEIIVEDGVLEVKRSDESKEIVAKHGLSRALINNMVVGVSQGFRKHMELVGVGYRASNQGQILELSLGFSHNIFLQLPDIIKLETKSERNQNPQIILESCDKQLLGQVAAKIRSFRKPEPYKGKGIRFYGEQIRRKAGKSAKV